MDNYIVSARKYRPSTFKSVVGQKSLTVTLKNAIQCNKLAHAYLFCGPRGVGKTSCARIFAKTINCLSPAPGGEACNTCESCLAFNEQRSYNIHELDAASNNSVDDIRTLIEQVRIPPPIGKYKVFIIDEVHMLSSAAFNAFLKTLEEPPRHVIFILATTEKHKVLPTILSRCQIYDFSRISIADMVEHLQYVAEQEHITTEAEALNIIAQKADGGMRDALSIFDQVTSFTGGNITYQAVIENLNVLDYEYYFRITDAFLAGNVRLAILILNEILQKGFDGQHFITGLAAHFRDLLVCKDPSTIILFEVGASIRDRYIEMAQRCLDNILFKAIELANTCDLNYKASRNKRLLLELTLIQLCQLSQPSVSTGTEDKKKTVIDPITPEKQPLPVAGQPKAADSPAASAATTAPAKAVPVPAPTSTQKVTEIKKKGRMPVSTSLKDMESEKEESADAASQPPVKAEEMLSPFTESALVDAWMACSETLSEQVHLKQAMRNNKPVLQDNYLFEVVVQNPAQQDALSGKSVEILNFIRTRLHNSTVRMNVRIDETNEKKLAVTSVEKYEFLRNENPLIDKLKEEFNLKLD